MELTERPDTPRFRDGAIRQHLTDRLIHHSSHILCPSSSRPLILLLTPLPLPRHLPRTSRTIHPKLTGSNRHRKITLQHRTHSTIHPLRPRQIAESLIHPLFSLRLRFPIRPRRLGSHQRFNGFDLRSTHPKHPQSTWCCTGKEPRRNDRGCRWRHRPTEPVPAGKRSSRRRSTPKSDQTPGTRRRNGRIDRAGKGAR